MCGAGVLACGLNGRPAHSSLRRDAAGTRRRDGCTTLSLALCLRARFGFDGISRPRTPRRGVPAFLAEGITLNIYCRGRLGEASLPFLRLLGKEG
jgi:hypothetical protein